MSGDEFWREAIRRRNLFLATWVGWLIAGPILWGLYARLLPGYPPMASGAAALVTWGAFWFWTYFRFLRLDCFKCGEEALDSPYVLARHMKCRKCGVKFGDT